MRRGVGSSGWSRSVRYVGNPSLYVNVLFSSSPRADDRAGKSTWLFICNPLFAERLLRATEVMSQAPIDWSQVSILAITPRLRPKLPSTLIALQAIVLKLLQPWGIDGYLEWLQNLRHSYAVRRDRMVRLSLIRLLDV